MHLHVLSPGETRSDRLIEALRDAILTGRYAPGSRLVQDTLAAEYGTSRIPLREALRRLEGEGLIAIIPNRGAVVTSLSAKDVADVFDLRLALESLALQRAAERYADLTAVTRRLGEKAKRAAESGRSVALFHLDRDFHAALAGASENAHLVAALDGQWSQIMRLMHAYLSAANYPADVWEEHTAIARAVVQGDPDAAVKRLRSHLTSARDVILGRLREGN